MRQLLNPDGTACGEGIGRSSRMGSHNQDILYGKFISNKRKKHVLKQPEIKTRTTKPYSSQLFRKYNFKCHKPEVEVTIIQILRFYH